MKTKIFITWSGEHSKKIAEVLRKWFPIIIQSLDVYFTPDDIEKNDSWNNDIDNRLRSTDIGIICLTPENLSNSWLHFEAGALSTAKDAKVCTFLFNLKKTDIKSPLSRFQATVFTKNEVKQLINVINNRCSELKLEKKLLDEVFNFNWPKLNKAIAVINKDYQDKEQYPKEIQDTDSKTAHFYKNAEQLVGTHWLMYDVEGKHHGEELFLLANGEFKTINMPTWRPYWRWGYKDGCIIYGISQTNGLRVRFSADGQTAMDLFNISQNRKYEGYWKLI